MISVGGHTHSFNSLILIICGLSVYESSLMEDSAKFLDLSEYLPLLLLDFLKLFYHCFVPIR